MKINDVKHNHSLTDLLKVLIFSILMLLPFINVGVRCGYVMLNKNAYQSYTNYNANEDKYVNVESYNDLQVGKTYRFISNNNTPSTFQSGNNGQMVVSDISVISYSNSLGQYIEDIENSTYFAIWYNTTYNTYFLKFSNLGTNLGLGSNYITFSFTYLALNNVDTTNDFKYYFDNVIYQYEKINQTNTLDNVFEYSVSQLEQNQLYNWTTQTAVYTGVSTMTTQLGITGNLIPMLVCYWFFLTIIYIILDIVIKLFTMLTHAIGSKKA